MRQDIAQRVANAGARGPPVRPASSSRRSASGDGLRRQRPSPGAGIAPSRQKDEVAHANVGRDARWPSAPRRQRRERARCSTASTMPRGRALSPMPVRQTTTGLRPAEPRVIRYPASSVLCSTSIWLLNRPLLRHEAHEDREYAGRHAITVRPGSRRPRATPARGRRTPPGRAPGLPMASRWHRASRRSSGSALRMLDAGTAGRPRSRASVRRDDARQLGQRVGGRVGDGARRRGTAGPRAGASPIQ